MQFLKRKKKVVYSLYSKTFNYHSSVKQTKKRDALKDIYICVYVNICVYTYKCEYIYIYTHTHTIYIISVYLHTQHIWYVLLYHGSKGEETKFEISEINY